MSVKVNLIHEDRLFHIQRTRNGMFKNRSAQADAVYTDTWTSMGQEADADNRRRMLAPYQVNDELMALARPGALFMHCLPAHREEEVSTEVIESSASVVFDQAENRLHAQKALLYTLMADRAPRT